MGQVRATAFAELEPAFVERSLAWFDKGPTPDDVELKPGRVWRSGPYAIKYFPPRSTSPLRRSKARRNADLHFSLAPVPTPRPLLVLERASKESLLAFEFVEGEFLDNLWEAGGPAVAAFPRFLADMHRRRIFHGDFHLRNFVWNSRDWVLLDLDGVRPPLHALRGKTLAFEHWARVHFGLRGARGLRASFEQYMEYAKVSWHPQLAWMRVVARSMKLARQRGLDTAYALEGPGQSETISPARQRMLGLVSWLS